MWEPDYRDSFIFFSEYREQFGHRPQSLATPVVKSKNEIFKI